MAYSLWQIYPAYQWEWTNRRLSPANQKAYQSTMSKGMHVNSHLIAIQKYGDKGFLSPHVLRVSIKNTPLLSSTKRGREEKGTTTPPNRFQLPPPQFAAPKKHQAQRPHQKPRHPKRITGTNSKHFTAWHYSASGLLSGHLWRSKISFYVGRGVKGAIFQHPDNLFGG